MNTNPYLIEFYNHYDEDQRLVPKHGSVEFLTTMRYIEKYIRPGDRVLEIGAGTGRYSHALARRGYSVDGVELIQHNIDIFRKNTLPEENITIRQGNALDLSAFPDGIYDITLLLGPLYHLYSKEDKLLKEFTEEADAKLYGYLTEIIRISSNDEDYTKKAKDMLEGVERKISVTNFGTSEYITGKKVNVTEPYTGLTGIFYIDGDEHNWKNGIYTNKLTLNFENMMDDKDSGSENK